MPNHSIPTLFKKIYAWLLPYHCILCGFASTRTQDLCEDCHHYFPAMPNACPQCAASLLEHENKVLCGMCLKQPPPFDLTHALYLYQKPITHLIMNLKFHGTLINAKILSRHLIEKIPEWYAGKPLPQAIFPVPLHPKRLQERGFNQALEIAKPIARALKLPLDYTSCIRHKTTNAQATLSASERHANIKNAFTLLHPIPYQHIAVIDDVITTGQTMREFCSILKQNPLQQIDVWCCARASLHI